MFGEKFFVFFHIRLTAKLYLLIVIILSFSATEIATQKQTLKKCSNEWKMTIKLTACKTFVFKNLCRTL